MYYSITYYCGRESCVEVCCVCKIDVTASENVLVLLFDVARGNVGAQLLIEGRGIFDVGEEWKESSEAGVD